MISGDSIAMILWKTLLLVLPISSLPLLSKLFGGTSVAPLSLVPMAILLLLFWLPGYLKSSFRLLYQVKSLLLFLFIGVISALLASFHYLPNFRGIPWWRNFVEAIGTLAMGIGYYLLTISMIKNRSDLRSSLKWILIGGMITSVYAIIQTVSWKLLGSFPRWIEVVQLYINPSGRIFQHRASGLAFEPSWLAHQLNMMYLPILLGLVVSGQTVFRRENKGKLSIEIFALILALVALIFSFSRMGWVTIIVLIAYLMFRLTNSLIDRIVNQQKEKQRSLNTIKQILLRVGLWFGLLVLIVGAVLLAGLILAKVDPRMAGLFDLERFKNFGLLGWSSRLGFAERMVFWMAAFQVFQLYPFFGAGLGLAGYFFQTTVPEFGSRLPEINKVMLTQNFIPNAKNLWVRLLSETGIVGFAMFASWVLIHWRNSCELENSAQDGFMKAMGLVGKLIVIAMILEGFSLDSFGLPYYWISLGLIAASWKIDQDSSNLSPSLEQTSIQEAG